MNKVAYSAALFLSSLLANGQTPKPAEGEGAQVLSAMLQATGWAGDHGQTAVRATGLFARFNEDGSIGDGEAILLKARGFEQFSFEVQEPEGTVTTIANRGGGIARRSDGTKKLPVQAAVSIHAPYFPFLRNIGSNKDSNLTVRALGEEIIAGELSVGIALERHPGPNDPLAMLHKLSTPLKVWISKKSFLPVRIDFVRLATTNYRVAVPYSLSLSDYRNVSGLLIPFQQDEMLDGRPITRLKLSDVQIGTGVTESDFNVQ